MRTKKELIKKHEAGELPAISLYSVGLGGGAAIYHIEHGIDDKVFGAVIAGDRKHYFFTKLTYRKNGNTFKAYNTTYNVRDFMRCNHG